MVSPRPPKILPLPPPHISCRTRRPSFYNFFYRPGDLAPLPPPWVCYCSYTLPYFRDLYPLYILVGFDTCLYYYFFGNHHTPDWAEHWDLFHHESADNKPPLHLAGNLLHHSVGLPYPSPSPPPAGLMRLSVLVSMCVSVPLLHVLQLYEHIPCLFT